MAVVFKLKMLTLDGDPKFLWPRALSPKAAFAWGDEHNSKHSVILLLYGLPTTWQSNTWEIPKPV